MVSIRLTPPPPSASNGQHLPYPIPPPPAADVICEQPLTLNREVIKCFLPNLFSRKIIFLQFFRVGLIFKTPSEINYYFCHEDKLFLYFVCLFSCRRTLLKSLFNPSLNYWNVTFIVEKLSACLSRRTWQCGGRVWKDKRVSSKQGKRGCSPIYQVATSHLSS